jgi:hypothetical protein
MKARRGAHKIISLIISFISLYRNSFGGAHGTTMSGGQTTMKSSTTTTPANLDFLNDLRSKYPHQPVYVRLHLNEIQLTNIMSDK